MWEDWRGNDAYLLKNQGKSASKSAGLAGKTGRVVSEIRDGWPGNQLKFAENKVTRPANRDRLGGK